MTRIVIEGERFRTSGEWTVNEVQVGYSATQGGTPAYSQIAYDPSGPDAAENDAAGVTVHEWTDSSIDFEVAAGGTYVASVLLLNVGRTESVLFDLPTDLAAIVIANVDTAQAQNNATIALTGTGLDTSGTYWRLNDDFDFDTYFYPPGHALEGNNPPGTIVTVNHSGSVTIHSPALAGKTITYIQTRSADGSVVDEWYGSTGEVGPVLSYPVLTDILSTAPDTIRLLGSGFQTATAGAVAHVVVRLAEEGPFFNGVGVMTVDLANPQAQWEVLDFSDTQIELYNPNFQASEPYSGPGDFVVTGAAFHDAAYDAMYYYEPWGEAWSTPVDGAYSAEFENVAYYGATNTIDLDIGGADYTTITKIDWVGRDSTVAGDGSVVSGSWFPADWTLPVDQRIQITSAAVDASGAGQLTSLRLWAGSTRLADWEGFERFQDPVITVTYDSGLDQLVITSDDPVFNENTTFDYVTDGGSGGPYSAPGGYVSSPWEYIVGSPSANLPGTTLLELDLYDGWLSRFQAAWTGSVSFVPA